MKNKIIIIFVTLFASQFSYASCGSMPSQPDLLNDAKVNIKQLEALEPQFEGYLQSISAYQACVDKEMTSIEPDSENYQIVYEDKTRLWDAAEEQKTLALERYNRHIETVNTVSVEETQVQETQVQETQVEENKAEQQ